MALAFAPHTAGTISLSDLAITAGAVMGAVESPAETSPDTAPAAAVATGPEAAVQALVARAQGGDQEAFAELYERFGAKILGYLRSHLAGRPNAASVAEDLAADVFLKALEKLGSYRYRGIPFVAWLYRIAHNRLVDHLRALPKTYGVALDDCGDVDDPAAEHALDVALIQQQLAVALQRLTPDQHQVICHRILHDRSLADTAAVLGKHEDAIKQLQVRALRSMRRALGDC